MIPHRRLVLTALLLTLLGVVAAFVPAVKALLPWIALAVLIVVAFDAIIAWYTRAPVVERHAPRSMSLSTWVDIGLTVTRQADRRGIVVLLYDHHPTSFETRDLPAAAFVSPGHFVDLQYSVRPTQRGPFEFLGCELRVRSLAGFWWRRLRVPLPQDVHVYPNYSTISKLLTYEVDNRLQLAGVRLQRRRGEGIEFHQLRDYRDGDSLRVIDWKATARMSRLIAREYQDERDQQIIIVLDAGRRMLAKDGELSHFDHTLNGMLLLAFVALRQGDAVGLMTVGDTITWMAPRKGVDVINALLNHVYSIQPKPVEIDYVSAATELAVRQRRRALIAVMTNVREEDSEALGAAVQLLRRRHLVILASLREQALDDALEHEIHNFDEALTYASTNQFLDSRREAQNLLRAQGVFVEDCLCEDVPAAITSRYLAIKRAGML